MLTLIQIQLDSRNPETQPSHFGFDHFQKIKMIRNQIHYQPKGHSQKKLQKHKMQHQRSKSFQNCWSRYNSSGLKSEFGAINPQAEVIILIRPMEKGHSVPHSIHHPKIDNFYNDILLEYQIRLEKQEKMGRIPPNKSQDIIKRIKQLSKNHGYLLKASHRDLIKKEEQEKDQRELRQLQEEEKARQAREIQVKKQQNSQQEDDQEFMQRQEAKKNQLNQIVVEPGIEKVEIQGIKEEHSNKQQNTLHDESEYEQTRKMRNYVHANLDVCLDGMFISSRKKYIAKSQKTKLDLDNVFIKFKDREIFLKTVSCELTTIKTNEIRINLS